MDTRQQTSTPVAALLKRIAVGVAVGLAAIVLGLSILRYVFDWPTFGSSPLSSAYVPEKLEATLYWKKDDLVADVKYSGIPVRGSHLKVVSITLDGIEADHPLPQIGHKTSTAFTLSFHGYKSPSGKRGTLQIVQGAGFKGGASGSISVNVQIPAKPHVPSKR